ncbi:hypothetical protein DPMN_057494 [Dreissena polymorpha]|uniref:Uncharacterized protein n=1 Tax=Dreissena polymorpha TaxID=45954 RepID=A0A9D4C0B8_DREPO|nr:hypothetical protein DPMN_057494 [Dreissena polymorpha]
MVVPFTSIDYLEENENEWQVFCTLKEWLNSWAHLYKDLNRLCVLGATQLHDLRVDSHTSYEHSSSVSEFQNCMADVLRSDLLQKKQTSCKYSTCITIDESTDISVKQNLVTYVRLLETEEFGMALPHTYFLGVAELQ